MNKESEILSFEQKYEIGMPVFKKLFDLPSLELKKKVQEICGTDYTHSGIFDINANVSKVIYNDRPTEITIEFYDYITITPFGITFNPEHGPGKTIVEFNKFFTL